MLSYSERGKYYCVKEQISVQVYLEKVAAQKKFQEQEQMQATETSEDFEFVEATPDAMAGPVTGQSPNFQPSGSPQALSPKPTGGDCSSTNAADDLPLPNIWFISG